MLFGCPGHEVARKGLSGCGIDTVQASVGTWFTLNLTVFDWHVPPAIKSVQRLILVVTPCAQEEIYCPELDQQSAIAQHVCGTTDCASRSAVLALQPDEETISTPTIEFSQLVPSSAVYSPHTDGSTSVASIPGHEGTVFSQARSPSMQMSEIPFQMICRHQKDPFCGAVPGPVSFCW